MKLNHIMCASRYGVELAYALLTTYFYQHNEKMLAMAEKKGRDAPFCLSANQLPYDREVWSHLSTLCDEYRCFMVTVKPFK